MRDRSLVRQLSTKAAAPGPRTVAVPRCETSNRPTRVRTASCSASTPPPAYSIGIDQPPKSASLAPAATCRSCRGEVRGVTDGTLALGAGTGRPPCRWEDPFLPTARTLAPLPGRPLPASRQGGPSPRGRRERADGGGPAAPCPA